MTRKLNNSAKRSAKALEGQQSENRSRRNKRARLDPIKEINSLPREEFEERYFNNTAWQEYRTVKDLIEHCFSITHSTAADLDLDDFEACFRLIQTTSKDDYQQSSRGWRPRHKRQEMKDADMHYIIVKTRPIDHTDKEIFQGFLSFMLVHDSQPIGPVLYIYEVHLQTTARRLGLGKKLFDICEGMARRMRMSKTMLTCFLSNDSALNFYKILGYEKDATSPENRQMRSCLVRSDYIIMSKALDSDQH